jgi:hypothetical protein
MCVYNRRILMKRGEMTLAFLEVNKGKEGSS